MHVRVAVVGAGFGGLGAAVRLRRLGVTDLLILERAGAVGGTWRDNTYPGCACDIPSHLYSFSFAPNPHWPRSFSGQPEIRRYLEHLTDGFGLRPHLRLDSEVTAARWDGDALHWEIDTSTGPLTAEVLVSATGPLSEPSLPDVPGLDGFPGAVFHSARWDHGVPLRGRRVAVVGTGASAVQFVPEIQREVTELTVFQRTPPWVLPKGDRPVTAAERALYSRLPFTGTLRRQLAWGLRELQVGAFVRHPERMRAVERLAALHLRRAVPDPELRHRLTPDYRLGCKRVLRSNDWYPTLARPHVRLVASGLRAVRGATLVAEDGRETTADVLVLGTGFRITDQPVARRVTGAHGTTLAHEWREGMAALRGTTAAGFPNLLTVIGPNTGLGNNSMILIIEAQLAYLADFMRKLAALAPPGGRAALTPRPDAVRAWRGLLAARLRNSVWNTGGCRSWYLDARGRNTTVWPGTIAEFRRVTEQVDLAEYEVLRREAVAARA
ncbi:NAD(P)/FAD-dependent oxidoreductase [Streptomyces sp. 8K308]|uniref:flavin-containing monooxygenase n=1 Tax=Streptomyces sp. 8K308 TaxID=2530388 RepID=UPI0010507BE1|nr:NAD(P)/FAD-dependent oxidoreductase [Streptomyces sp. 8K308]TDC24228.1 NAD(P)/FAD-dependent oxidoreductase [Streptomyces sp. 8K308]